MFSTFSGGLVGCGCVRAQGVSRCFKCRGLVVGDRDGEVWSLS